MYNNINTVDASWFIFHAISLLTLLLISVFVFQFYPAAFTFLIFFVCVVLFSLLYFWEGGIEHCFKCFHVQLFRHRHSFVFFCVCLFTKLKNRSDSLYYYYYYSIFSFPFFLFSVSLLFLFSFLFLFFFACCSVMMIAGMYSRSGQFSFSTGVPTATSRNGLMIIAVPNRMVKRKERAGRGRETNK